MTELHRKLPIKLGALLLFTAGLTGCINPLPGKVNASQSDPRAIDLLHASAAAHGGEDRFVQVESITVDYDGTWLNDVWDLQPILVDRGYRKTSHETITYGENWPVVEQRHEGPEGVKQVRWPAASPADVLEGGASVLYDGQRVEEPRRRAQVEQASAMVAEAYRMFLTGPFYFIDRLSRDGQPHHSGGQDRPVETVVVLSEPDVVAGVECDQLLFRLRPGFGTSEEDRVQVAIGKQDRLVRRVRFSLEGFEKTRGATADIELSGFETDQGLVLPTQFLEIVTHPIDREVHRWQADSISIEWGQ